jgi:hypothetical protein
MVGRRVDNEYNYKIQMLRELEESENEDEIELYADDSEERKGWEWAEERVGARSIFLGPRAPLERFLD